MSIVLVCQLHLCLGLWYSYYCYLRPFASCVCDWLIWGHEECVLDDVSAVEAVMHVVSEGLLISSISVSEWRCCKFVFRVQPIIARRQMLCTICILFIFVSDMIGNYIVFAYSMTGWITVLQVLCSVSLYLSQVVAANIFMICIL